MNDRSASDKREERVLGSDHVAAASAVLRIREGDRARLELADLLALAYIRCHLSHRIAPPVSWAVEAVNSPKLRYQVGGARAEGVVTFLLDYAATPFRTGDLAPGRLVRYFDWYLSVKVSTASANSLSAAGYQPNEAAGEKLARDMHRFHASCRGGSAREAVLRREWERAVREIDLWR